MCVIVSPMKTTWSDLKRGDVLRPLYSIHNDFHYYEHTDSVRIRGRDFNGDLVIFHIYDVEQGMEILVHEMVVL